MNVKKFFTVLVSLIIISGFLSFEYLTHAEKAKQHKITKALGNNPNESSVNELDFAFKEFKIDSIFRRLNSSNRFNGCVLVAQHGKVIYKNSFGIANPVLQEPLTENSVFQLASVSKTITGVSVLFLYEWGKILLDDPYSMYFPEFPYKTVTIRDLLSHCSGLPDYTKMSDNYFPPYNQYLSNEDVLTAMINAHLPLACSPGSRYRYNNSNYALLALLVERLSGKTFPDFVAENIFKPLGMNNSYIAYPEEVWSMPNRTFGFNKYNRINENDKYDGVFGDKGAYSTVDDMFKFDQALYPGVLLSQQTLDVAFANNLATTSSKKKYGCGFRLREDQNDNRVIYHNGWWHGYRTAFHRRESDKSCVIILSNRLDYDVYGKAKEIFNLLDNYYPEMYANSKIYTPEDNSNNGGEDLE